MGIKSHLTPEEYELIYKIRLKFIDGNSYDFIDRVPGCSLLDKHFYRSIIDPIFLKNNV
jgi:hypothetical protein